MIVIFIEAIRHKVLPVICGNILHSYAILLNACDIDTLILHCIPVCGRIKYTARMDNLVIPQCAGWITSYPPIVNGYVIQTLNTKL